MDVQMKVCTIGGGTGMPIINKGLVKAGFRNIKSIVTTFDNGGDSGRMRTDERGKILAFSDYWRSLISLWDDGKQKNIWEEMLRYRDGRERNFGNMFFQFLSEKEGGLSKVTEMFKSLTQAELCGEVIPVSLKPSNICFSTISGKNYVGEHNLDDLRMSLDRVKKIWLEPKVEANIEAVRAIQEADVIVICPGSIYGSVLINFLPTGINKAFAKTEAKKLLFTNIVLAANENDIKDQNGYLNLLRQYMGKNCHIDFVISPDLSYLDKNLLKKVLKNYSFEHSELIGCNDNKKERLLLVDLAIIEKKNLRLRHCESKLAKWFNEFKI